MSSSSYHLWDGVEGKREGKQGGPRVVDIESQTMLCAIAFPSHTISNFDVNEDNKKGE